MDVIGIRRRSCVAVALFLVLTGPGGASVKQIGDLPRANGHALQDIAGVDTEYSDIRMADGGRIRTIVTKPSGASGRLPAIAFVHWLSCDSVDFGANATDGWSSMLRRIIRESGAVVQRIDKSGVGDSTGTPCRRLGYEAELAQHRAALDALAARPDVDPSKIVVFGASMGATYAPLLAVDRPVAGVIVWGGGASTWFERTMLFERHALELGGLDPSRLSPEMTARAAFLARYLIQSETPEAIARTDAELGRVWPRLIEARGDTHYGRPTLLRSGSATAELAGGVGERSLCPSLFSTVNTTGLRARTRQGGSPTSSIARTRATPSFY